MKRTTAALASAVLLVPAAPGGTCSISPPAPAFSYKSHPDFPVQPFAKGRLGIVLPTWRQSYLVAAYRYLAGIGLDGDEQRALLALWARQDGWAAGRQQEDAGSRAGAAAWSLARRDAGLPDVTAQTDRLQRDYSSFRNCLDDAFATAAATLRARVAQYGASSPIIKEWAAAQDIVFGNCGGDPVRGYPHAIPQRLERSADPSVAADRDYQIASALFYSGEFDLAESAFRRIAATPDSSWSTVARHLAARSLIRKATLGPEGLDRDALAAAGRQLRGILDDVGARDIHPATERLLGFVRARLEPEAYCRDLAAVVVRRRPGPGFAGAVADVARCWNTTPTDDFSLWLRAMAAATEPTSDERRAVVASALERWRHGKEPHWLVAAVAGIGPGDPQIDDALDAARAFDATQPGGPTIAYYLARLELARGDRMSARRGLDRLLERGEERLGRSSYNLVLDLRGQASDTLDDLLGHAARRPAGWVEPDLPNDALATDLPDDAFRLDPRTAAVLTWLPLPLQIEAVNGDALPEGIRLQVASGAWVKAVALGSDEPAQALARRLSDLRPNARELFRSFLGASSAAARSHEALMILAYRTFPPTVLPLASLVGGTPPPPDEHLLWGSSDERRSWSCGVGHSLCTCGPSDRCPNCELWSWSSVEAALPAFLDADQRAASRREWETLKAVGSGPEFLAMGAIEWSRSDPTDQRIPEILHRAVASSQWACEGDRIGALSRRAFAILHTRYAETSWTEKTKYWYRGR